MYFLIVWGGAKSNFAALTPTLFLWVLTIYYYNVFPYSSCRLYESIRSQFPSVKSFISELIVLFFNYI